MADNLAWRSERGLKGLIGSKRLKHSAGDPVTSKEILTFMRENWRDSPFRNVDYPEAKNAVVSCGNVMSAMLRNGFVMDRSGKVLIPDISSKLDAERLAKLIQSATSSRYQRNVDPRRFVQDFPEMHEKVSAVRGKITIFYPDLPDILYGIHDRSIQATWFYLLEDILPNKDTVLKATEAWYVPKLASSLIANVIQANEDIFEAPTWVYPETLATAVLTDLCISVEDHFYFK